MVESLSDNDLVLGPVFCDHMVVQQGKDVPVWGRSRPLATVELSLAGRTARTKADEQGHWHGLVPPAPRGTGHLLTVTCLGQTREVHDVASGELWLCAGQSNMVTPLGRVWDRSGQRALALADLPVRFFLTPDRPAFDHEERDLPGGRWVTTAPDTLKSLGALAYFLATDLAARKKVPVGIVLLAVGGTPIEAFLPDSCLPEVDGALGRLAPWRSPGFAGAQAAADEGRATRWRRELDAADRGCHAPPEGTVDLPGSWAGTPLGSEPGSVWFSREVTLTGDQAGQPARLDLGTLVDADTAWVNGVEVGSTAYRYPPRRYELPPGLLKEGPNQIEFRQLAIHGSGGSVVGKPMELRLGPAFGPFERIDLRGPWQWRRGATVDPLPASSFPTWVPGALYRGMVAPVLGAGFRGVVWYQGESDVGRSAAWRHAFGLLVSSWRAASGSPHLPFFVVQLAGVVPEEPGPPGEGLAELRQAQWESQEIPGVSVVPVADLGEANDLHPETKDLMAQRVSEQVLWTVYGDAAAQPGPRLRRVWREEDTVVLDLEVAAPPFGKRPHVEGRSWWELAGSDGQFIEAQVEVRGPSVRLRVPGLVKPRRVRHGWGDCPIEGLLVDAQGVPLPCFEVPVSSVRDRGRGP